MQIRNISRVSAKTGKTITCKGFTMAAHEFTTLIEDSCGLCISCGAVNETVDPFTYDPDHTCGTCGTNRVYPLEGLVRMRFIDFIESDSDDK